MSHYSPVWPGILYVDQADLYLYVDQAGLSNSRVLPHPAAVAFERNDLPYTSAPNGGFLCYLFIFGLLREGHGTCSFLVLCISSQ